MLMQSKNQHCNALIRYIEGQLL